MLFFALQSDIGRGETSRGIADAFSRLYEEFLPKVLAFVSYRIADTQLAEDLTSAVFEKALTKFKSYNAEKAEFSTWIISIARNTLTDHFRSSSRKRTVQLDSVPAVCGDGTLLEDAAILSEERHRLHSCIAKLTAAEQEIISLKFGAEMTNRQIARVLGLSESNVGVIVFRAVRRLRDDFGEREDE